MKTYFAEPAVEVIKFHTEDVITASATEEEDFFLPLMPPCA